jgi:hypothetical protein
VRLKLNHWQYKTLSPSHAAKRTLTNNTTNQTTLKNPTTSHYHCWFTFSLNNTKVSNTIYTLSIFMFFYLIFNYTSLIIFYLFLFLFGSLFFSFLFLFFFLFRYFLKFWGNLSLFKVQSESGDFIFILFLIFCFGIL